MASTEPQPQEPKAGFGQLERCGVSPESRTKLEMNKLVLTVALCLLASHVHGQGATSCNAGAGQTTASSCGAAPSMCAAGGTSAWVSYPTDPTVNATTGVFTVSYKSNGCPKGANSNYYDDGTTNGMV
jgi:hypothetical protein